MILYHGSNVTVEAPKLLPKQRNLDFGPGFYTTSDKEQAIKWAKNVTARKEEGNPTLNIYEIDENEFIELNVLKFETANEVWLEFVCNNRKGMNQNMNYDIVIGPVANDSTIRIVNDYIAGYLTKKMAIE